MAWSIQESLIPINVYRLKAMFSLIPVTGISYNMELLQILTLILRIS